LLIDSEIKRLIDNGHARATEVLTENVDKLHAIAGALLEYETLTGEEIKRLAAGEDIGRDDPNANLPAVPAGGTAIPKTKRPAGPFGNPAPAGA
jgi:cell division protease FtsH